MTSKITIRKVQPSDAAAIAPIIKEAFDGIADKHAMPRDFPEMAIATGLALFLCSSQAHVGFVAVNEQGEVIGSNFLTVCDPVAGVGPISVSPKAQGGVGKLLMHAVLDEAKRHPSIVSVRLVQDAFNMLSFSLYTKCGFVARHTTAVIGGTPINNLRFIPGRVVRKATLDDVAACDALHIQVHGLSRAGELTGAIHGNSATVVVNEATNAIVGFASSIGFIGFAVAKTNDDLKALIAGADKFELSCFHVPTGNHELILWCYENGLKLQKMMTLMTTGVYQQPAGAFLPSVSY